VIAIALFLDRIRRELTECPQPVMIDAVRDAAREFCDKTQVWRETVDDISTIANEFEYDIEPPTRSRSVAIISMVHHGKPLRPKSERELNDLLPNWQELTASTATWFVSDTPELLRLVPYPSESETDAIKQVRLALKPTHDTDQLPDILHRDYLEDIGYGAMARLFRIPKSEWKDLGLADFYQNEFMRAIGTAKLRAARGYQNTILQARPTRLPGAP